MSNAVPQKKTFFQIANKNFIMLFVAYTVICITHSMTNSVTSAGRRTWTGRAGALGLWWGR